jgi:hypothetical protein
MEKTMKLKTKAGSVTATKMADAKPQDHNPAAELRRANGAWASDHPKMTREEVRQIVMEVLG